MQYPWAHEIYPPAVLHVKMSSEKDASSEHATPSEAEEVIEPPPPQKKRGRPPKEKAPRGTDAGPSKRKKSSAAAVARAASMPETAPAPVSHSHTTKDLLNAIMSLDSGEALHELEAQETELLKKLACVRAYKKAMQMLAAPLEVKDD